MTNITHLVSDYLDRLTTDERLQAMEEIQLFGHVWLPQLAEVFPDRDYSTAVVELAAFAALPDDFCDYITSVNLEAAARICREQGAQS